MVGSPSLTIPTHMGWFGFGGRKPSAEDPSSPSSIASADDSNKGPAGIPFLAVLEATFCPTAAMRTRGFYYLRWLAA